MVTPQQALLVGAGLVLLVMGIAVLALRYRNASAVAFGVWSVGGGAISIQHAMYGFAPSAQPPGLAVVTGLLLAVCWWALLLVFPTRVGRADLGVLAVAAVIGLLFALLGFILDSLAAGYSGVLGFMAIWGLLTTVFFFPLRTLRLPKASRGDARSMGIFAAGLAFFLGGNTGYLVLFANGDGSLLSLLTYTGGAVVLPTLVWVAGTWGAHAQVAKNVVLAHVIIFTAALLMAVFAEGASAEIFAVGRLLGALVLGYAVLRGQFDGLDLKVRFALSKSTIAAAFIAVFFVASEGAQLLFGQQNELVGLAAAGALVFAMAPLQRVADRFAQKAVPSAAPTTEASAASPRREQSYREAVERALHDRRVTSKERLSLFRLAEDLAIPGDRAAEIQDEVEGAVRSRGT